MVRADPPQKAARRTFALSLDDLDRRIYLAPKEVVSLQITDTLPPSEPITLSAPSGGNINGGKGHAKLKSADALRDVQFAVGDAAGLYVLEIKHGKETRTIEFWVGAEPPRGKAGPERTFHGDR